MANFYTEHPELRFHLNNPLMERICELKERSYRDKDEYDYAPQDYADAIDSYDKVLEITGEITGEVIAANAEGVDEEGPHCANGRVEYASGTKANLDAMVKAGMAAPSGMDRRPWEFVVVTDREALDSMAAKLPYAKMLTNAPLAIVVCGDTTLSSYWYLDCSAATQNVLLAAEALGLGAVWTAAYPYEDRIDVVRQNTGLPENIVPLCVIPIGYPDGPQKAKDKFDPQRVHRNKY